jgi:hypothetical protein
MTRPIVELLTRRGRDVGAFGVGSVPLLNRAPDPTTFRHWFYYNTRENVLYKKTPGANTFFWARITR